MSINKDLFNNIVNQFNNIHNNGIYIQPSQPSVDTWQQEFKFTKLPMKAIPFGVDTNRFIGNDTKNNIIVYYKSREPSEFKKLIEFLNKKKLKYRVFNYQQKYQEEDFLNYLKTCKYGIVLGRHESQGFAIQEMLSCNIPLLIWGSKLRKQEYPNIPFYNLVKSEVSTVPYWSDDCGELFHEFSEIENKFETFIQKIDSYKPRNFILNNLSMEKCSEKWNDFLLTLCNNV